MNWIDIAMLVFSATLSNHMGLIEAVEKVIRRKIPIVNCCKCLSFWLTLSYSIATHTPIIESVAISFLASYTALWLELLFGCLDSLYNKIYENICPEETANSANAED